MAFANLHRHSEYSDGLGHPIDAAQYAKELGQTALGLTDHGTVSGLMDHWKSCRDAGVKPILGVEAYHQRIFAKHLAVVELGEVDVAKLPRYHLTLLALTTEGYKNLLRVTTEANAKNFYRYPIVDDMLLEKFSDDVACLSGCLSSYIAKNIVLGCVDDAFDCVQNFRRIFGENFYLEVQPFGDEEQAVVNRQFEIWSDLYDIPIIATADSHFIRPEDQDTYGVYQKIRNPNSDVWGASERFMPSEEDMIAAWEQMMHSERIREYLNNSQALADQCDVQLEQTYSMPKLPWVEDEVVALVKLCKSGIKKKALVQISEDGRRTSILPQYEKRMKYELETFVEKGFAGYMLLNADIAIFCAEHGICYQARGSVCGSLVAYLLGVTTIDPLVYQTSFERFCGPDRKDQPDVDWDIEDGRREEVVVYIKSKFNAENIPTIGCFKTRGLVNKLVDVISFENGDAELFREHLGILDGIPFTYQMLLKKPVLKRLDEKYCCVKHFCKLYAQANYIGEHPAGVALTAGALTDRTAVMRSHDSFVTSYDMKSLDIAKVTKVDILGVQNLTIVKDAEVDAGVTFTDAWCHHQDVLDAFASGRTIGIFQFERRTPRNMLKKIAKARGGSITFEDIAVVNACNRPMPIQEKSLDLYCAAIAGSTDRAFIYQEDVMETCREAGMSWEQVSKVLKALKRYQDNHQELEEAFVTGMMSVTGGGPDAEKVARSLWQSMRRYLFPKSHAVSYAQLAAREMYLKLFHPLSFYLALLRSETDKSKRSVYASDAVRTAGLRFMIAHVNGDTYYQRIQVGDITFIQEGLLVIPDVGVTVANAIVDERERNGNYKSQEDLYRRVPPRLLNVRIKKALDTAGASEFEPERFQRRVKLYNLALAQVSDYGL